MTKDLEAKACWISKPGEARLRAVALPELGEGEARVRSLYSAISRGTESLVFAGKVPESERERMRAPYQEGDFPGPVKYGYINVGIVEAGPREITGKTVFCLYPHQNFYQVPAHALTLVPAAVPAERAVLAAGMETALNALWDAEIKIGDRVVVVGAGVIGALVAYLANGVIGTQVTLLDVDSRKAEVAAALGIAFSSDALGIADADLVVHASCSSEGLATAIEVAGQEARIVELSWYGDVLVTVPLGGAFHAKRIQLLSSQVGHLPPSQTSRWDYSRRLACALELLDDATLDVLISGECEFGELPDRFEQICAPGSGALCYRVRYPTPD